MKYSIQYRLANFLKARGYRFDEERQPEVIAMQKEINDLENKSINFETRVYPDGSWIAKSTNVEGILTGGRNQSEINDLIKDAIFTYYGISPQYANDRLLRNTGEPVTVEQSVHVTA